MSDTLSSENPDQPEAESGSSALPCSVSIEVKYFRGDGTHYHSHTRQWERLPNLHCPNCGEKAVWHEDDPGDYYVGEDYQCARCGAGWNMPSGIWPDQATDKQGAQVFAIISSQND